ncbi:GAF domain-containing protein [Baaleninema simplex]|uniref:GAF domain-containing protein n=1 Tax=Baaleninema simplex TaxID=2862350 RepID=UPI0003720ACC|nr:GAF domain-containing protein [Baaleninema simplex]
MKGQSCSTPAERAISNSSGGISIDSRVASDGDRDTSCVRHETVPIGAIAPIDRPPRNLSRTDRPGEYLQTLQGKTMFGYPSHSYRRQNSLKDSSTVASSLAFDTQPNEAFEDVARLATYICHAPIALIGFINTVRGTDTERPRYWVKAAIGIEPDRFSLCFDLCAATVKDPHLTIVPDLQENPHFAKLPFITSSPHYRFYVGVPLVTPNGSVVGTLCVLDYEPHHLDADQQQALETLSRQATRSLQALREFGTQFSVGDMGFDLLRQNWHQTLRPGFAKHFPLPSYHGIVEILESITEAFFAIDRDWKFVYVNRRGEKLWNVDKSDLLGQTVWDVFPALKDSIFASECQAAFETQTCRHFEEYYEPLGIWLEVRVHPESDRLSIYFRDVTHHKHTENALLEQAHLSALVTAVSAALAQSQTLSKSLELCVEALSQNLDAAAAAIWLVNADDVVPHADFTPTSNGRSSSTLVRQAMAGRSLPDYLFPPHTSLGESLVGWVAQVRQPYVNNTLNRDAPHLDRSSIPGFRELVNWAQHQGIVGLACYPLVIEERLLGVVTLCSQHPWTQDCSSILNWVTSGIGLSVDRVWAREALVNRRKSLLFRLAGQIRNSLDLDTILDTAVHEIRALLQIDRCYYLWCSSQSDSNLTLAVTHEAREPHLTSFLGESFLSQSDRLAPKIWTLELEQIDDITDANTDTRDFLQSLDVASQLTLPLGTRSGQFGAIVCCHTTPRPWTETEVELLQAVVDQLAIAIDQAELYAKTCAAALAAQTQARQLQEAMEHLKQTEAQLIQQEKMSSLGQMVAGIAHEINNPVNFITGNIGHAETYIEDLLELVQLYRDLVPNPPEAIENEIEDIDLDFLEDDLPKLLDSMKMGAERIRQIVVSLRNFSRLDEAEVKPVNLHEGLENTLLILHNRLKGKGDLAAVRVIKYYGELPRVDCFPGLLNQVFMNVIANAIDALEEAGLRRQDAPAAPTITICTEAVCSTKDYRTPDTCDRPDSVIVRIRDNGMGIKPEILEKLFDPFFTTKPVGKGTGLGLSISYQIVVDKHRGRFWCESELGKGTEFFIHIPIKQPDWDL